MSDFLIFKAAFNNSSTPAIGTYTAEGATAQFNKNTSISPDYYLYNATAGSAVQWFVPTAETTDFEFVADILTRNWSNNVTYFIVADSTGTTRLRMWSVNANWYFENSDSTATSGDPEYIGVIDPTTSGGFGVFHRFRVRVRKLTESSSSVEIYVDGTLKLTATAGAALVTCAKIGFVGGVNTFGPGTGAGIKNAYVYDLSSTDVIDRGVLSEAFNRFINWMKSKFALKSDIPTVNNGTLTIQQNGTDVQTFTANQSTAATANIIVPTAVSELTNDSGYLTSSSNLDASKLTSGTVDIARLPQGALERLIKVADEAARYALTTADVQLGDTVQQLDTGIMYIVTDADHLDSAAGYTEYTAGTAASVPWSGVTGKPTFAAVATSGAYSDLTGTPALAAVATSGAYSDLTGTPTIPTVNDATLTIQQNGTNVQTFTANQSTNATANIQCVDLSTAQTVAGVKTFSDGLFASISSAGDIATLEDNSINSTNEDANGMPLTGHTSSLKFKGSQSNVIPCMLTGQLFTSGNTSAELRAYKYKDASKRAGISVYYTYANDIAEAQFINCHVATNGNGLYDIGSSSRQFGTAYIQALNINGTAAGDILTHNASEFVDVTTAQTIAGDKDFTGTTGTHDVIPATTDTYDLGSSAKEYNNAYIKALTINGTTAGDILTHNADEFVPIAGTNALAGSIVPSTDNAYDLGSSSYGFKTVCTNQLVMKGADILRTVDNVYLCLYGGTDWDKGATLSLNGKDNIYNPGGFYLRAHNGTNYIDLYGQVNGSLTWGTKNVAMAEDVVPRSGGAVMTGSRLGRTVEDSVLRFDGGNDYLAGASLSLYGRYETNLGGAIVLTCSKYGSTKGMLLYPDGTWTWEGTACQLVSDQRLKQQIAEIDDKLLDAWEDVEPVQFKYNDAVDQKGDKARLHTGYVVQQIDEACKSHDVDISAYGLFCHEEYPEETEEVEVEQKDGTKKTERKVIREANEHYSLRYTECLVVECKYLRRCIQRLTARIEELEKNKEQEATK